MNFLLELPFPAFRPATILKEVVTRQTFNKQEMGLSTDALNFTTVESLKNMS